jgi:hypothetical protein
VRDPPADGDGDVTSGLVRQRQPLLAEGGRDARSRIGGIPDPAGGRGDEAPIDPEIDLHRRLAARDEGARDGVDHRRVPQRHARGDGARPPRRLAEERSLSGGDLAPLLVRRVAAEPREARAQLRLVPRPERLVGDVHHARGHGPLARDRERVAPGDVSAHVARVVPAGDPTVAAARSDRERVPRLPPRDAGAAPDGVGARIGRQVLLVERAGDAEARVGAERQAVGEALLEGDGRARVHEAQWLLLAALDAHERGGARRERDPRQIGRPDGAALHEGEGGVAVHAKGGRQLLDVEGVEGPARRRLAEEQLRGVTRAEDQVARAILDREVRLEQEIGVRLPVDARLRPETRLPLRLPEREEQPGRERARQHAIRRRRRRRG